MRLGIDLGGTKISLIALDDDGQVRHRARVPTPQGDYAQTVATLVALVGEAEAALGWSHCPVGIGTPGSVSPMTGVMRNANSTCLNGRPLREDLIAALGPRVRLSNDANCFAVSEATDGAGAGARVVFGVILGTGVGGGVVVDGRLIEGANGIGGEWGHSPLPGVDTDAADVPSCYCGRRGCIEAYLCGGALADDHLARVGTGADAATIAAAAQAGDVPCRVTLERYSARLARALSAVINLLDPEVIVLGGGVSNIAALYELVPRYWGPHVFSDQIVTSLRPARFGDDSGVRGAAWLNGPRR